jgi:hypothetical protein
VANQAYTGADDDMRGPLICNSTFSPMRFLALIGTITLISTCCVAQYTCSSGNIGAGATCACNIEWDTNHVTEPGGNELRVYDVCYQTSAGVSNKDRIAVFIHGAPGRDRWPLMYPRPPRFKAS